MTDVCPTCLRPLTSARLTPRELDVLLAWWTTGSVQKASRLVQLSEQRAKNLLQQARTRSRARTNEELLDMHFAEVRERVAAMQHNVNGGEAA